MAAALVDGLARLGTPVNRDRAVVGSVRVDEEVDLDGPRELAALGQCAANVGLAGIRIDRVVGRGTERCQHKEQDDSRRPRNPR